VVRNLVVAPVKVPLVHARALLDTEKLVVSIPLALAALRRVLAFVLTALEDAHALVTREVHAERVLAGLNLSLRALGALGLILVGTRADVGAKEEDLGVPSALTGTDTGDTISVRRGTAAVVVVTLTARQDSLALLHPGGLVVVRAKLGVRTSLCEHLVLKDSSGGGLGTVLGGSALAHEDSLGVQTLRLGLGTEGLSPLLGLSNQVHNVVLTLGGFRAPIRVLNLQSIVERKAAVASATNHLNLKGADEVRLRAVLHSNGKFILVVEPAVTS
jgi:hypothetical protein